MSIVGLSSGKIEVENIDIYYEKKGTGDHVIFFIPGALGTLQTDFVEQFNSFDSTKFTLICWNAPGYGKSRPPPRYYEDYYKKDADYAGKFMACLGINKYSVIGFSDGGRVALMLAARRPDQVKKVIAWGCNAFITQAEKEVIKRIRCIETWSHEVRKPLEAIYGDELQDMWDSLTDQWVSHENIFREDLPKIVCPVFLMHGEKDPMVARHHADYFKQNLKLCRVHRYPLAGHNLQQTNALEFNQLAQEFLLA
ncbi:Valacyclovir hydrolase [Halotydeus destructor]|nr:Valacyclovir hydrolase [Halotydeus destructor]